MVCQRGLLVSPLNVSFFFFFWNCSVSFRYESAILVFYLVQGDPVEEFQPLCEVQSDKATIEITSRFKGKVALISHTPGDIIKVRAILNEKKKKSILLLFLMESI